jgi:hypothetical protein
MPSLLRFLAVLGLLGGVVFGGLFVLATFFEPQPRETVTAVPNVKVKK